MYNQIKFVSKLDTVYLILIHEEEVVQCILQVDHAERPFSEQPCICYIMGNWNLQI